MKRRPRVTFIDDVDEIHAHPDEHGVLLVAKRPAKCYQILMSQSWASVLHNDLENTGATSCNGVNVWRDVDGDGLILRLQYSKNEDVWFRFRLSRADAEVLSAALGEALADQTAE